VRRLCRIEPTRDLPELLGWLREDDAASGVASAGGGAEARFGCCDGSALYRVTVHPERLSAWLAQTDVPPAVASLDVAILHGLILQAAGSPDGPADVVGYTAEAAQAVAAARGAQGRSAWLLRGVPLERVHALAAQGLRLPPKSTYFYPKVPSGLVINSLT